MKDIYFGTKALVLCGAFNVWKSWKVRTWLPRTSYCCVFFQSSSACSLPFFSFSLFFGWGGTEGITWFIQYLINFWNWNRVLFVFCVSFLLIFRFKCLWCVSQQWKLEINMESWFQGWGPDGGNKREIAGVFQLRSPVSDCLIRNIKVHILYLTDGLFYESTN